MTTDTKEDQTALTLPQRAAVALGTAEHEIRLRELAQASCRIIAITNRDGREEAHRAAMTLRDARTSIEKTGKAAREDATAFSKAVIAEEKRLIAIIEAEETRVLALRDAWDERIAAEKAAKIAAERVRVEAIQGRIEAIRRAPLAVVGESSAAILITLELVRDKIIDDSFEELKDQAMAARSEAFNALEAAHQKAAEAEAAALAAEQARLAEIARIAAEREELAQLRAAAAETARLAKIETDRVAAEQAAEARRLADLATAQAAELQRARDAEAARVAAEQSERDRVAAETKRQIEAQQAAIAAERAAFAREQEESRTRAEAAARLERDHAEALEINERGHYFSTTTFRDDGKPIMCNPNGTRSIFCDVDEDSGDEADRARLQTCADEHLADARERANDERKAGLPAGSLHALMDSDLDELDPTDEEITAMGAECGLTPGEWVIRLSKYVAAQELVAA